MFRSGVQAANDFSIDELTARIDEDLGVNQTVTAAQVGSRNVFRTNFWYFTAAATLELLCMSLILPTTGNGGSLGVLSHSRRWRLPR